jgi:multicomponent Na+:H+ antiporter subunit G
MSEILTSVMLVLGAGLGLLAGIGLHRFPDVFARMHAASKPATLGVVLLLTAAAIQADRPGDVVKLALVGILQFITAPVGAHMVGRAAYRAGDQLSPNTSIDELAGATDD